MARNINPVPHYSYAPSGKMYYFKSGTNTQLATYKDQLKTILNTHPVDLDDIGRLPNVFFDGSAKQILTDAEDEQIWNRDPVGGEKELGNFTLWDTVVSYKKNDITKGSDGRFYISLSNSNAGNDPISISSSWSQIRF